MTRIATILAGIQDSVIQNMAGIRDYGIRNMTDIRDYGIRNSRYTKLPISCFVHSTFLVYRPFWPVYETAKIMFHIYDVWYMGSCYIAHLWQQNNEMTATLVQR